MVALTATGGGLFFGLLTVTTFFSSFFSGAQGPVQSFSVSSLPSRFSFDFLASPLPQYWGSLSGQYVHNYTLSGSLFVSDINNIANTLSFRAKYDNLDATAVSSLEVNMQSGKGWYSHSSISKDVVLSERIGCLDQIFNFDFGSILPALKDAVPIDESLVMQTFGNEVGTYLLYQCNAIQEGDAWDPDNHLEGRFHHFFLQGLEYSMCVDRAGVPRFIVGEEAILYMSNFLVDSFAVGMSVPSIPNGQQCDKRVVPDTQSEETAEFKRLLSRLEAPLFSSYLVAQIPNHPLRQYHRRVTIYRSSMSIFDHLKNLFSSANVYPSIEDVAHIKAPFEPKVADNCVFLHGLGVQGQAVETLFLGQLYWKSFRTLAPELCNVVTMPQFDTVNMRADNFDLQNQMYEVAMTAQGDRDRVFAHSMGNVILARACLDQGKCVKWFAMNAPIQGSGAPNRLKAWCEDGSPTSSFPWNIVVKAFDAILGGVSNLIGYCSVGTFSLTTCSDPTSAAICPEVPKTVYSNVHGSICGTSGWGLNTIISPALSAVGQFITEDLPNDGMVSIDSCIPLTPHVEFSNDWNDRYYMSATSHADGMGLSGDGSYGNDRQPVKWAVQRIRDGWLNE